MGARWYVYVTRLAIRLMFIAQHENVINFYKWFLTLTTFMLILLILLEKSTLYIFNKHKQFDERSL